MKKISFRLQLLSTNIHLDAKPETGSLDNKCADKTKLGGAATPKTGANSLVKNEIPKRKKCKCIQRK